jgi:hypothetical protein
MIPFCYGFDHAKMHFIFIKKQHFFTSVLWSAVQLKWKTTNRQKLISVIKLHDIHTSWYIHTKCSRNKITKTNVWDRWILNPTSSKSNNLKLALLKAKNTKTRISIGSYRWRHLTGPKSSMFLVGLITRTCQLKENVRKHFLIKYQQWYNVKHTYVIRLYWRNTLVEDR